MLRKKLLLKQLNKMSIIHPATILIAGGTGSGKTVLTKAILRHHDSVFECMPANPRVIWCYGIDQENLKESIPNTKMLYHEGIIDQDMLARSKPDIVIIDDMMNEKSNDNFVHNLFTKISHHMKISVIFITQNMYEKGQCKMKRNAHYLIMMRNPSDKSQITTLGRQLFPRKKSLLDHFYESYDDATSKKFGYLFIDVSPHGDEKQKLKTNIIPDSRGCLRVIVYLAK